MLSVGPLKITGRLFVFIMESAHATEAVVSSKELLASEKDLLTPTWDLRGGVNSVGVIYFRSSDLLPDKAFSTGSAVSV